MRINPNDRYQCQVCGDIFVVPSLARCCELKHEGVVFTKASEQEE